MNEQDFKQNNRADHCSGCTKRLPCGTMDSICELITPCAVCEIKETCSGLCSQIKAFLSRGSQGTTGKDITYNIGDIDDFFSYKNYEHNKASTIERKVKYTLNDVPWGSISARDKTLIIDHFSRRKTLVQLAKEHNLTPGRISQLLFGSRGSSRYNKKKTTPTWGAIKVLRTYIRYRELYNKYGHKLYPTQRSLIYLYYFKFNTVKEIANDSNTLPVTIYRRLAVSRKKLKKYSRSV